jgi:hypothetical protein
LFYKGLLLSLLLTFSSIALASSSKNLLPDTIKEFRGQGKETVLQTLPNRDIDLNNFAIVSAAKRTYAAPQNRSINLTLVKTRSDSAAYSLLTRFRSQIKEESNLKIKDIGTEAIGHLHLIAFFKGNSFALIESSDKESNNSEELTSFAKEFAASLSSGEGELPPLIKHLPEWEKVKEHASYAVSSAALKDAAGSHPVFETIDFNGGVEAATAQYNNSSRLVIVEYPTPQLASYNDANINKSLEKLKSEGQSTLPLYKRVGNYSVFVFNAPDEKSAQQLAESVKYEQVVRWLGENPFLLEKAQKMYAVTVSSILLSTLKATGLGILLSIGVGGLIGAIVFFRRRAQQNATDIYSDAGGMTRLNLDELGTSSSSIKLLGKGDG